LALSYHPLGYAGGLKIAKADSICKIQPLFGQAGAQNGIPVRASLPGIGVSANEASP